MVFVVVSKKPKITKVILRWLVWKLLCIIVLLSKLIPYRFAYYIGGFLGGIIYSVLKKPRELVCEHLKVLGELPASEIQRISRGVFVCQARSLLEWLSLGKLDKKKVDKYFILDGKENLRAAVDSGRGIVIISGHLGNWETGAAFLSYLGCKMSAVTASSYDDRIRQLIVELRKSAGINTITRGNKSSSRQLIRAIKNKDMLVALIDQDIQADGIHVNFFGRDAYTPTGIISIGLKKDMIFLPLYSVREKNGSNRLVIEQHIDPSKESGSEVEKLKKVTQNLTLRLENAIRNNPEQWVWMHKRWKTKRENVH